MLKAKIKCFVTICLVSAKVKVQSSSKNFARLFFTYKCTLLLSSLTSHYYKENNSP